MHALPISRLLRLLPVTSLTLVLLLSTFLGTGSHASAHTLASGSPVDVTALNGDIDVASQRFLTQTINTAEHDGSQALVIQINTPGGDLGAMQAIIAAELNSTVPIIAYVSPSGGYAASAGAFVALAAPIVAMAPTTTIGAASA
ncbi:MAG: ATP-dependent Clp protease proteolytic subunit, partial [Ktedonobacteraceae bacterium]